MSFAAKIRASGELIPCALLIIFIIVALVPGWATARRSTASR